MISQKDLDLPEEWKALVCMINQGYYDRAATAPGAQLIIVYYQRPNLSVFEKTQFNYLEKR